MEKEKTVQEALIIDEEVVNEEKEIKKPILKKESDAHIEGKQSITDNMKDVKEYALALKEYYGAITYSEDQVKLAKEEQANINKEKKKISDFRKEITEKWNKPLEDFIKIAKETESILKETYDSISCQVKVYEDKVLEDIKQQEKDYFEEYRKSKNIDIVTFENMNMNITKGLMTTTGNLKKSTIEAIETYIDNIENDLKLIEKTDYKEEVLVEYKKHLKVATAIADVIDRHKAIEEMQKVVEEPKEEQQQMEEKVEEVLQAPKQEQKIMKMSFTVYGTIDQLKDIKNYLEIKGVKYE